MQDFAFLRTFFLFIGYLFVVNVDAASTTSLYIPLADDASITDSITVSQLGVDGNGRTSWLVQEGTPTVVGGPSAVTLVEGPTDAVVNINGVNDIVANGFVSCAYGNGQASCAIGASTSGFVTLIRSFTDNPAPTAVLLNGGSTSASGSANPSSTTSSGSSSSSSNPSPSSSSSSSPTSSSAKPTSTGKNSAMRQSPVGVLLVTIGGVMSYLAL